MKKFYVIFVIFIVSILSGCKLIPGYSDPSSLTVDGKKYITGFYDDLYALNDELDFSTSSFVEGNFHWWVYEGNEPFDMYFCEHKEAIMWKPTFYVLESQFNDAKEYYKNINNFKYYMSEYSQEDYYEVSGNDVVFEYVVQTILHNNVGNHSERLKIQIDSEFEQISFFRQSNGGLFITTKEVNYVVDGVFYVREMLDGQTGLFTVIKFSDEYNFEIMRVVNSFRPI